MDIDWSVKIGVGVIDCSLSKSGMIVAGDINGDVLIIDKLGVVKEKWNIGMPIWGIDICEKGKYIAISAADKANSKGAIFIYEDRRQIFFNDSISEAWDVVIDDSNNVYFSTWYNGIINYNINTKEVINIEFKSKLFGLSVYKKNLYVTISGIGLGIINLKNNTYKTLEHSSSCYNNFCDDNENVYVGSDKNQLIHYSDGEVKKYNIGSSQICGISRLSDYIIIGDLDGYLYLLSIKNLSIPILRHQFPGGIWNIEAKEEYIIIACGNGVLYRIDFNDLKKSIIKGSKKFIQSESNLELLKGIKIFLSYSRYDEEKVNLIYRSLESIGCTPWMDQYDVLPGQDWKLEVRKAIQDSQFVLIFLSKNSTTTKGYFQKEIREAFEEFQQVPRDQIFLIPIKLDNCEIPQEISRLQFVEFLSEESFDKILRAIYHQTLKLK